jgi:hypothetical protein
MTRCYQPKIRGARCALARSIYPRDSAILPQSALCALQDSIEPYNVVRFADYDLKLEPSEVDGHGLSVVQDRDGGRAFPPKRPSQVGTPVQPRPSPCWYRNWHVNHLHTWPPGCPSAPRTAANIRADGLHFHVLMVDISNLIGHTVRAPH